MIAKFGDVQIECRDDSFDYEMTREIWGDRYYTEGGFDIPHNGTVLDIGGCIGGFAIFAASKGARIVYTFEPIEESFALLVSNVHRNYMDNVVKMHNCAVTTGDTEVKISGFGVTDTGLLHTGVGKVGDVGVTVPGVPIAQILKNEPYWDYVKFDIEGYEYAIFDSMSKADFDKIGTISMEFHGDGDEDTQAKGQMLVGLFKEMGFGKVDYKWSYGNQGRLQAKKV